jgi:TRAP-type C4-dicarboxylate transport system permease small subunit
MLRQTHSALEWLLEWVTIALMLALTIVVIVGVTYRLAGNSLSWYDEIASVLLAWITYYGAALAALKRRHIGFDTALLALPTQLRMAGLVAAEALVIGFFLLMTWAGLEVLDVLEGMRLVALTWMPIQVTQSVIPIGGALFILCELISLPEYWRMTAAGISLEHAEIEEEVAQELKQAEQR